jgi:N-acetylglucosaminyl-diphospho-decaprenol L-rhamnosyltransferase
MKNSAYIVVVNRGMLSETAIGSLTAARLSGYFTAIVENGKSRLCGSPHHADLTIRIQNRGYGHAVNTGIRAVRGMNPELSTVVFSNDDIDVPQQAFDELGKHVAERPECFFSLASMYADGTPYFASGAIDLRAPHMRHLPAEASTGVTSSGAINGAIVACTPKLWDELGGFDERFFLYFEDLDFSMRLAQRGIPVLVLAGFPVVHQGGQSTADSRSRQRYHYVRSQIAFARKWLRRDQAALVVAHALVRGALGGLTLKRDLRHIRRARFHAALDAVVGIDRSQRL